MLNVEILWFLKERKNVNLQLFPKTKLKFQTNFTFFYYQIKNKIHNGEVGAIFERTQQKYSSLLSIVEIDYAELGMWFILILTHDLKS